MARDILETSALSPDLSGLAGVYSGAAARPPGEAAALASTPGSFLETVQTLSKQAIEANASAETLAQQALRGEADLTEVIPAVLEAERQLSAVVAFRDRIVQAYQQISQMPI